MDRGLERTASCGDAAALRAPAHRAGVNALATTRQHGIVASWHRSLVLPLAGTLLMVAPGWLAEGDGPDLVEMCSPD